MDKNKKTLIASSILIVIALLASFAIFTDQRFSEMSASTGQIQITNRTVLVDGKHQDGHSKVQDIFALENGEVTLPFKGIIYELMTFKIKFETNVDNNPAYEKRIMFKQICEPGEIGFTMGSERGKYPILSTCTGRELTQSEYDKSVFSLTMGDTQDDGGVNTKKAKFRIDYQVKQVSSDVWDTVGTEKIGG